MHTLWNIPLSLRSPHYCEEVKEEEEEEKAEELQKNSIQSQMQA